MTLVTVAAVTTSAALVLGGTVVITTDEPAAQATPAAVTVDADTIPDTEDLTAEQLAWRAWEDAAWCRWTTAASKWVDGTGTPDYWMESVAVELDAVPPSPDGTVTDDFYAAAKALHRGDPYTAQAHLQQAMTEYPPIIADWQDDGPAPCYPLPVQTGDVPVVNGLG